MANYPTEIYVRSIDENGIPNGYVKARYLTDNAGNYIFNPIVEPIGEKYNVFIKDAAGNYDLYLSNVDQFHSAIPYIVPFDYDPRGTAIQFDRFSSDISGRDTALGLAYKEGGSNDLQRTYNGLIDTFFVPQFKAIASYDYGLAAAAAGLSLEEALKAGGYYNKYIAGFFNSKVDASGAEGNNPVNVPNITLGWNAFRGGVYDPYIQVGYDLFGRDANGQLDPAIVSADGRTSVIRQADNSIQTITIGPDGVVTSIATFPDGASYAFNLDSSGAVTSTAITNADGSTTEYIFDPATGDYGMYSYTPSGQLSDMQTSYDSVPANTFIPNTPLDINASCILRSRRFPALQRQPVQRHSLQ